jgi:hypothetical protein
LLHPSTQAHSLHQGMASSGSQLLRPAQPNPTLQLSPLALGEAGPQRTPHPRLQAKSHAVLAWLLFLEMSSGQTGNHSGSEDILETTELV